MEYNQILIFEIIRLFHDNTTVENFKCKRGFCTSKFTFLKINNPAQIAQTGEECLWTKKGKRGILKYIKEVCAMSEKLSKLLKGQIVTSVFYILFGICLVFMPVGTVNLLCKVVFGLVLIGAGLYHIFLFAAEKDKATILDLFSGVIVFVIGLFLFTNPQIVVKLLPLMLGALVLVDSIWTLRGSMKLKKRTQETWKFLLIESLVFVGLGVFLMMYNFQSINGMLMFAGWAFLVDGILDVVSFVMLKKGLSGEVQTAADETPEKHAEKEPDTKAEEAAEEKEIIPEWNSRAASVSTEVIPPEDVTVEDTQEISEAETKEENLESDHLEEQEQN